MGTNNNTSIDVPILVGNATREYLDDEGTIQDGEIARIKEEGTLLVGRGELEPPDEFVAKSTFLELLEANSSVDESRVIEITQEIINGLSIGEVTEARINEIVQAAMSSSSSSSGGGVQGAIINSLMAIVSGISHDLFIMQKNINKLNEKVPNKEI